MSAGKWFSDLRVMFYAYRSAKTNRDNIAHSVRDDSGVALARANQDKRHALNDVLSHLTSPIRRNKPNSWR